MSSVSCQQFYYYRQIVDNKEEVFQLRQFVINLGKRIEPEEEEYISSDEEYKYFGFNSGTESYDSDTDGFPQIINEYNRRISEMPKTNDFSDNKKTTNAKTKRTTKKKTSTNSRSKGPKTAEPEIKSEPEPMQVEGLVLEESATNICEQTLLEDDFYETNMQFFMSQSLPMTQSSALIQQNGRFSYYLGNDMRNESLKVEQSVDHLLIPLIDLVEDSNCWPLVLKTITEYMFAFRKSSKSSKYLAHKVLAHYNWSDDKFDITCEELSHTKRLHYQFLDTFMREILLNCYSRNSIMEVIGCSDNESNAWLFVLKLITFLVNESIRKSDSFSMAFIHFKYLVEVFIKDFQQFLSDSNDYCVDILRIERENNYRPLVCRLIWSSKTPNYLNSVLKQLIFLITKVIKIKNDSLLIEVFKLFEGCVECFRVGSGNVRPYTSFTFDRPTPITELFQQLSYQSLATNEVFEKLLRVSNICWIKVQLCGHFMTQFIVGLKNKYLKEKHRKISLKLIVECLTNAKLRTKTVESLDIQPVTDPKPRSASNTPRKRSSLGLANKKKISSSGKEWSKKNKYGETLLHTACIRGHTDKLKEILQLSIEGFGPDPNDTDNAGYTPLSEAVIHSHVDCIRALIEWQNDSNKMLDFEAGPEKQTPLHESIENNAIECAKLIIESGGLQLLDIKRDSDGKTPKDLIKNEEMKQMIESLTLSSCSKSISSKININSTEDSRIFIQIVIELIINYIETTKIDRFLDDSNSSDGCIAQELWQNKFFEVFQRDITECDISSLIEDLAILRKLPIIVQNLKTLFDDLAVDLLTDLESTLSLLVI